MINIAKVLKNSINERIWFGFPQYRVPRQWRVFIERSLSDGKLLERWKAGFDSFVQKPGLAAVVGARILL